MSEDRSPSTGGIKKPKKKPEDFTFGDILGEGSYGAVVLGTEKETGNEYAIKILEKKHIIKQNKIQYVTTERDIMTKCEHPNIVSLYCTFTDKDFLYYVLEICSNGELYHQLKKHGSLSVECTKFYSAQLINALEYLHTVQNVIHRDLKPENILFDSRWQLKLTDFGTAKIVSTDKKARATSFVGTADYISPELLESKYSCKSSDLWALGCIIYQMIGGRSPFRGVSDMMTFQRITSGKVSFPEGFPNIIQDLIEKVLVLNPEERLGSSGYQDLKNHEFFKGINFETLHEQTPPQLAPFPTKLRFEADIIAEEEERKRKKKEEESAKWKKFLRNNEVIEFQGTIWKRKGLSIKKRHFILTSRPRLIYVDVKSMTQKGEIPWSKDLKAEVKDKKHWRIYTKNRVYYLEDAEKDAQRWVDAINTARENDDDDD